MLKLLGKLFNRDLTSPSERIETNASEDDNWDMLHPNAKADLERRRKHLPLFVKFITSHLDKDDSQRLSRNATDALNDEMEDSYLALEEGLNSDDGQDYGKWILITIDWKATEEITWQVNECLSAFGVDLLAELTLSN